jgi:hypothetical protein
MKKRFHPAFVLSLFVLTMLSASWLPAQQADDKTSADKDSPEQNTLEKSRNNPFRTHCELTTCVNKVFYLSNISQPTELQDFVNLMRTIAEVGRIQQIPSEQLVVVRGTPEQIAFAQQMADEINKDKRRFGGIGYRLDFKVNESEGAKKLRSRTYALVTDGRENARLAIEKQSPAATVARNIECHVVAENERTIELSVDATLSGFSTTEFGKDDKSGLNSPGSPDPTQLHVKDRVLLELGKPTVIGIVDDPDSERTFQLEVTATRVTEK